MQKEIRRKHLPITCKVPEPGMDQYGGKLYRKKLSAIAAVVLTAVVIAVFVMLRKSSMAADAQQNAISDGKPVRILFIGNSHTYYNDLPLMVQRRAAEDGYACGVTMIAHGGWYLKQHVKEPEVRFNILYGGYDYVVLQEYAQPFAPADQYEEAAKTLNKWIRKAGSKPVLFETWAVESEPEIQPYMNEVHKRIADEIDALSAPVGENWWREQEQHPDMHFYDPDGEHASETGSEFAAQIIWETIRNDFGQEKS